MREINMQEALYANVIVDISHEKLDRTFQYLVPESMRAEIKEGMAVEVPFGRGSRTVLGYVVELTEKPVYDVKKIKEIAGAAPKQNGAEGTLIALAAWMRAYYGSTMLQALKAVLPVRQKTKEKREEQFRLLLTRKEAEEKLVFFQQKHQTARARLMEAFLMCGDADGKVQAALPKAYVAGTLKIAEQTLRALEEQGVLIREGRRFYRDPLGVQTAERAAASAAGQTAERKNVTLNAGQQQIVDAIRAEWAEAGSRTYLIHGVTGSGKTEVYMELIACALERGEQAIVLIPEIALTYQTVMRFYQRFGDRISILHSRLSAGERYDQYEKAKKGLIDIMIGPRSALFTPFSRLGVIIIDEEHEDSYKSESVPCYHARETAEKRAELEGAKVILGSATPSVESYDRAQKGEYRLFTLEERVQERRLPLVEICDMRAELKNGNRGILSARLLEWMAESLQKRQQVMLFLNRRGYAGFVSCRSCGHVMGCPHCDVSLALHGKDGIGGRLKCHYCGHEEPNPQVCPKCGSPFIGSFKAGTQQVVEQVRKCFPNARILRMDQDTTKGKDGHAKILSAFADREADILIGTQMIVKGHDFSGVTLVGALAADLSLHVNDYRAAERTFQLLTQAAGRAGRGEEEGRVVIQTYAPEHYSIVEAAKQDYRAFYEQEIVYRRMMGYPPAAGMLLIRASSEDEAYLQMAMDYLKKYLERLQEKWGARLLGPADDGIAKISDRYRKILYIRHEKEEVLFRMKQKAEQYIEINRGFDSVEIQFDRL